MNEHDKDWESQLDELMGQLSIEKAPPRLTRRLKRIPREHGGKPNRWSWLMPGTMPRWALAPAFAAVPLLVIAVVMMQPKQPSRLEIEQARQDVAMAFAYLDKVGFRTGSQIHAVLGGELRRGVKKPLSEHMPFTEQSRKEETT